MYRSSSIERRRFGVHIVGGALVATLTLVSCAGGNGPTEEQSAAPAAEQSTVTPVAPRTGGSIPPVNRAERPVPVGATPNDARAAALPVEIAVPRIDVRSELELLGLEGDGAIAPPVDFDRAGWFSGGPTPGEVGPAVVAGHVDSLDGPAVFARLEELVAGDVVVITRSDQSVVQFEVTAVARYPQDDFPSMAVFGPTPAAALRLITCGGEFDRSVRHYRDNVVVFAKVVVT